MGRGRSVQTKVLLAEAITILEAIQPATVRAVCYRLFSAGLLPNMAKASTDKVSNLLARAREDGSVPWAQVVDDGRRPQHSGVWKTTTSFAKVVEQSFRLDPWTEQDVRVEVWSEKGTVAGILAPVLSDLAVTFRVNRGFASATAVNEMAMESRKDERPLVALYVGDYDPSGLYMSEMDLVRRLEQYLAREDMVLRRIALSDDDVDELQGLSFPVEQKSKDPRYDWYVKRTKRTEAWELDAMDPNTLRDRVRTEITKYIDPEAWERVEMGERAQRQSLEAVMNGWAGLSPGKPGNTPAAAGAAS